MKCTKNRMPPLCYASTSFISLMDTTWKATLACHRSSHYKLITDRDNGTGCLLRIEATESIHLHGQVLLKQGRARGPQHCRPLVAMRPPYLLVCKKSNVSLIKKTYDAGDFARKTYVAANDHMSRTWQVMKVMKILHWNDESIALSRYLILW